MPSLDKDRLKKDLLQSLSAQRDRVLAAHKTSQEGVVHEDAKAEGDKDMRATEASYVARGQAMRVEALVQDVTRTESLQVRDFGGGDPIALSALVTVEDEKGRRVLFLAPAGGGITLEHGGQTIQVVTPSSPLGRALLGKRAGDLVVLQKSGSEVETEIVDVA